MIDDNRFTELWNKLHQKIYNLGPNEKMKNINVDDAPNGKWTQYAFVHKTGREYGYNSMIGDIEKWFGTDPLGTEYTILNLNDEKRIVEGIGFFELVDLVKEDWNWGSYMVIYTEGYKQYLLINDSGGYCKNFL
jgi:hypothetical protein